ncbi:hypothetical protein ACFLXH_05180 [Chloroflexota bacterium]
MDILFESIYFLAIGLLAITIAVFVLAVSLLGRAIRISAQEQAEAEEARKKDIEKQLQALKSELDEAKNKSRVDVEKLKKSISELDKQQEKHMWRIRWIKMKPKLLTANGGVLLPGFFFLLP